MSKQKQHHLGLKARGALEAARGEECLCPARLCQSWLSFRDGIDGAETVFG